MNEKRKIFIREYLKDFNGTRAYKVAYPNCNDESARRLASKLLTKVDVQKAIRKQADETLKEVEIDVAYIVNNIKEVVERCMEKEDVMYFDRVDRKYKPEKEYVHTADGEIKEEGIWKFDPTNALKGLELLGKYKSIFKDNVDLNVKTSKKLSDIFEQLGGKGLDE